MFLGCKIHSPDCRTRFQDIVDNESAQTAAARVAPRPVRAVVQHRRRVDPRGRMLPWNLQRARQQSTSFVVRTLEAADDTSAKRQKLWYKRLLDLNPPPPPDFGTDFSLSFFFSKKKKKKVDFGTVDLP